MSIENVGLKGNQFEQYFKKIYHVFQLFSGVVAIDEIPRNIKVRHFIVCNLSPAHLSGSHWLIILRKSNSVLEIFNSLGTSSLDFFRPYFNFQREFQINFNKECFQSDTSNKCGYFCIYFIVFRILNYDMDFQDVLEDIFYTRDLIKNDEIVSQFSNNLLTNTNDDFFSFHDV